MRTPDRIEFVKVIGGGGYNPHTGRTEEKTTVSEMRNCMIQRVSVARQFEDYGTRDRELYAAILAAPYYGEYDYVLISSHALRLQNVKCQPVEKNPLTPRTSIRVERVE